jgi:tetratricopeptide (TPR) repeat protein
MVAVLAGCSKPPKPMANEAVAIAQVEYQGDDAAGRDLAGMVTQALSARASAVSKLSPIVAGDSQALRESGASRWMVGTLRGTPPSLRVHLELLDAKGGLPIAVYDAKATDANSLLQQTAEMAKNLLGVPPVPLTGTPADWMAYSAAQRSGDLKEALALLERSPDFGFAYPLAVETLLRQGRADEARKLAARMPAGADPLSRAQVAVQIAGSAEERLAAIGALSKIRPMDARLSQAGAELAASAGNWPAAVTFNQSLVKIAPSRVEGWNALGYAYAQVGNLSEAVKALLEYQRLEPRNPNALDSLGEVHYMNRRFLEAAKYFDQMSALFPEFMNRASLRKAAFAYFHAGDVKSADERFEQWLRIPRIQAQPSVLVFQRAMWLAKTKRWPEAQQAMRAEAETSQGARRARAEIYLAMMRFGMEKQPVATGDFVRWRQVQDPAVQNDAALLALLSGPSASMEAWRERMEKAVPASNPALRAQLLATAQRIENGAPAARSGAFPLPSAVDSPIDALVLKSAIAVLP